MATATPEKLLVQVRRSCPYWSPFTSSCLLVKNDLFIPLKSHVAVYCFSSRFSFCPTYLQFAEADSQPEAAAAQPVNHRRSVRIPGYHDFRFSQIITKQQVKTTESTTWTLDLSDHGLRFASSRSLIQDTAIRFFVEDETKAATIEGVGKVVWSAPLKNTSLYQVGVAITWLFR